jgi:LacI family transcriptional regulator
MKDVARLAGVSAQTVSAVVNKKPGITDNTRERVLQAIKELGYRPYSVARSLRTGRTRTIALVISDIANPSFATMASVAEDYAHSFGYNLVLYNTHDDIEREASYVQTAAERWVDGVLFVAAQDQMDGLSELEAAGIPAVAIDRIPEGYTGPSVTLDNVKAGRIATNHLLDLGHSCIAHISGPQRLSLVRERMKGFCLAFEERGLEPGRCVSGEGDWECEAGYLAAKEILASEPRPTALFVANDRMAIGAASAAYEAGLRVPDDLSVVGLDDIEVAAFQSPPLTTVRQSFKDLATLAVQLLLDILAGKEPERDKIVIEPELIVRGSTTAVGG